MKKAKVAGFGESSKVMELKNDTSKIIEIHCKKQCFGLRRLQDGAKMDPKMHFFESRLGARLGRVGYAW